MALIRKESWASNELPEFFREHERTEFVWGTSDCCLIAADAVLAITGTDIADDFRGKYRTETEALALIKTVTNGSTVADAAAHCAAKHGLPEWDTPLLAKRGDLVTVQDGDRLIAGVVHTSGQHVISIGPNGLRKFPLRAATHAWKV